MKLVELPPQATLARLYHGLFDDFNAYVTGDEWTLTATDSGTAAIQDAQGGQILLNPSDGTVADNDEVYLKTTKEIFKQVSGCPIVVEARIKWTEANTDDANVAFGLMNAVAANSILDDGAGPANNYNGACFFKVDGGTIWYAENSDGATQKTTYLDGTHELMRGSPLNGASQTASGGSFQVLRIEWLPKSTTKADWLFYVDGVPVMKHTDQPYASATEMNLFVGAKNGGANQESIYVDYIFGYQKRA